MSSMKLKCIHECSCSKRFGGTKRDTGLDFEELSELSRYYKRIVKCMHSFEKVSGEVSEYGDLCHEILR